MPSTIRRISAIAFAFVAVALLVISAFAYRTVQHSIAANRSVAHTYEVLHALERVRTTVVDAETGTRGFAINRVRSYLEPFDRANAGVASPIDDVAALTADNPVQQREVAELRTETTRTLQLLRQIVLRVELHEPIPAELSDREQASMDAVRATLQRMRVEEQRLMAERIQRAASADTGMRALIVVLIATVFAVLGVSFVFVDRRAVELARMNQSLAERVRARTTDLEQALGNETDARQQAEHAEERIKRLIEAAPTAIVVVDRRGTIVLINVLTERLFGYSHGELVGKSVEVLVPSRFRENHARDRFAFSHTPTTRQMGAGRDLYALRKDGTEVPVEIGLNPIEIDGEILVLGSILDITERERAERERAQLLERERLARAEADKANRSKDVFLARVSHELRTPLNALMGWARMLKNAQVPPEKLQAAIAAVDRNAEVLQTLVEDLVEMSRISTGKLQLDRRPLDITALVRDSADLLQPAASEKNIRIVMDMEARPIVVNGDAQRLRQVVWNLLSNAIKFTPASGKVTLRVSSAGDEVRIDVTDTGQGIAPEFLPRVFEPFSQAENGGQGLGLGLAIVQQLVDGHGGRIQVFSSGIGAGATFTVMLPLVRTTPAV